MWANSCQYFCARQNLFRWVLWSESSTQTCMTNDVESVKGTAIFYDTTLYQMKARQPRNHKPYD